MFGARRSVVDIGFLQGREAGADRGGHQHVDAGEYLPRESPQDGAATAEGFHVVRRRDRVAGIHAAADMGAVGLRVGAHPLAVDRCGLDPGHDAAIAGDRVHQGQVEATDRCPPLRQNAEGGFHCRDHRVVRAIEKHICRDADAHAPQVAGHEQFVVRHWLVRTGRVAGIVTGDHAGIVLLTVGLTALVLSLIEGNRWHWGSPAIIGLWIVAAVALMLFFRTEARVRAPMLDPAFFRNRTSAGVNLVAFIVSFALFAQFFFLTLYMQNVLNLSPLETGVRFLPTTVVLVVMGPVSGRLTDRIGPRPLMTLGTLIVAVSIFIESRITVHSGYLQLLPGFILMGFGMGLVMSPMTTAAMNAVDRTKAGAASGVLSMSRMVGSTFGVAVMGAIVTTVGRSKLNQSLPQLPATQRNAIVSGLGSGATGAGTRISADRERG